MCNRSIVDGYTLKSITECNGEIFVFLLNESELTEIGVEGRGTTTTIEEHTAEE